MDFLDLLGVPYHAPGVFFLGTDFLFKSILAFCAMSVSMLRVETSARNLSSILVFQIIYLYENGIKLQETLFKTTHSYDSFYRLEYPSLHYCSSLQD